ncbi:MAG TPA: hypothetical protein VMS21_08295 [Methylomirabilota bacterium]|nr:hypothetical protein [Methylomirabilota bacterium]
MKLFQNPYVVGALAVVAVVVVFRSSIQPLMNRNAPVQRKPAAKAVSTAPSSAETQQARASSPAAAVQASAVDAALPEPRAAIDLALVGWELNGSPTRDPFQVIGPDPGPEPGLPTANELLMLSAIWRQTGGSLAVINGRILRERDTIDGFEIVTIESNAVRVTGLSGPERLDFRPPGAARTNASPKPNVPAKGGVAATR